MNRVVIMSINLQNFYGDADYKTFASRGKNQTHILAAEVSAQARHFNADVICAQEDEHGLAMSEYDEVASACLHGQRGKEVVRTYVKASWHKDCTFATVELTRSDECPMPTRCALIVSLPVGVTVANVFLAGGRMDDEKYFWHWGCEGARREHMAKILAYRPSIIVGDWNANPHREVEERAYPLDSKYFQELLAGTNAGDRADAWRRSWLEWRHSPFQELADQKYELAWPEQPTAVRGELAVDGYAYDPNQCRAEAPRVINFLKHYTDHAGIVSAFEILPDRERRGPLRSEPESPPLSHMARPPTKLFHATAPLGVLFKATNCDVHSAAADTCLAGRALSKRVRRVAAASHVLLTGPMGLQDVDTPYTSFSGSLTEALEYGIKHGMKYVWRYCPSSLEDVHDLRSQSGIRRLNRFLPKKEAVETHEGHRVSTAWAKWKNLDSGINFDQVLVPRALLRKELGTVTQIAVSSTPTGSEVILEEQRGLYKYDEYHGIWSYTPQSAFLRNEARLRQLLYPGAGPSDEDCVRSQPTRTIPRDRFKRPDYIHSSSESEIEDAGSEPPVTRRSPNAKNDKSGKRRGR